MLIAHRGNDQIHKENSKEAILNSLNKKYVDGVEFDIHQTKDDYFVLNHNVIYKNKIIKNSTLKELKNITELKDLLKQIKSKKIIIIEIKNINNFKKLNKILKKYKLNYYLCSFNYELIKKIKEISKYRCGLILGIFININKNIRIFDFLLQNKNKIKKTKKLTFIYTINKQKEIYKNYNIITDNSLKISKMI